MIGLLTGALMVLAAPPPPGKDVSRALKALQRHATVSSRLEQTRTSRLFARPQQARGRVILVPPSQLRWEYTAPYRVVLVLNGEVASMSYPDLGRKERFDLRRNAELRNLLDTILFFLKADGPQLTERYHVMASARGDTVEMWLVPRSKALAGVIARLNVVVDVKGGYLRSFDMIEPDGDATRLTFSEVKTGQPVDPALLAP